MEIEEFDFMYKKGEEECIWTNGKYRIYYPCIKFIQKRIEEANNYGMGVSVWDGGQAPHFFYHLF